MRSGHAEAGAAREASEPHVCDASTAITCVIFVRTDLIVSTETCWSSACFAPAMISALNLVNVDNFLTRLRSSTAASWRAPPTALVHRMRKSSIVVAFTSRATHSL